jgi:hypothetical protein
MLDNVPRKTGDTRERLLELAESAVLAKGFAATSIDELIAAAGISKAASSTISRTKANSPGACCCDTSRRITPCSKTSSAAATSSTKIRCKDFWLD